MINLLLQALAIGVIVPVGIVAVGWVAFKAFMPKEVDDE
jgi:hypothetical protein